MGLGGMGGMETARSWMVGWARTTMATTTTKTTTNSVDDDCRAMRREDIDCGGRIMAEGRGEGQGGRAHDATTLTIVRQSTAMMASTTPSMTRAFVTDDDDDNNNDDDDDDDDKNAFAFAFAIVIAIAMTDDNVRRWRTQGRWPLRAAKRDRRRRRHRRRRRGGSSYSPAPRSLGEGRRERIDVVVPLGRRSCRHPHPCCRKEQGRPGVRQRRW
jgi:hypothetical protein